jgi:hypothetical protein
MTEASIDTLTIISTIVMCCVALGGLLIVVIKMQFKAYDLTLKRFEDTLADMFDKIALKKDERQCALDRANCPCVIETKGLTKRVEALESKQDLLRRDVDKHLAVYEK